MLGGALALGLATPAFALAPPPEPTTSARAAAATFTPDLQTEIQIGDRSRPSDFVSSPDGAWGYVTADELNEFIIINMAQREITQRITLPSVGGEYIRVTTDGARAYFALTDSWASTGVGVMDLTDGTLVDTFTNVPENIQEIVVSADSKSVYILGLRGELYHLDAATGEVLGRFDVPGNNAYALALIKNDTQLLAGAGDTVLTLDVEGLTEVTRTVLPNMNSVASLHIDQADERVYFADAAGNTLGVFNPETGDVEARASVGSPMHQVVGFDSLNRAFGNVPYWDMIMAADFTTGKRSESFRETPTAPFSLSKNPVTGELLSANGGWSNSTKGSTVTIVHTPQVSDPQNVRISAIGEAVRFETDAVGIKRGHGGGIAWQSSTDGKNWEDIEAATGERLDIVASPETLATQYRVRWADDFWGQQGASQPARIVAQGPEITFEGPLDEGTVGEEYPETVITATGQDDLSWSLVDTLDVVGLPEGIDLDKETGTLSGTPATAGTYTFTVRVTDVFGTDSRGYELKVVDAEQPVIPVPPTGPTDPTDPTDPVTPPTDSGKGAGGILSETGGVSPLMLALIAAGIIAAGGTGVLFARHRRGAAN